jgi:predicted small metal-binding protein
MKTLRCRDVGFDCDQVIHADTEEEVLQQAAEHAQRDHNVSVTPEIVAQVRAVIREEMPAQSA